MDPLVIGHLVKKYGAITAVNDISFQVKKGEVLGLIGPDGAGKTTTMRTIVSLIKQTAGSILFQGKEVKDNLRLVRSNIGYMPQRFSLYQDLTVEQNLRFFGDLFGVSKVQLNERIERLYEFSRLKPFKHRTAGALSGGMKQKLALSCILVHEPEVLVLDEPTVGVDPISRHEFWEIIHELSSKGKSILVSTSYMDEASQCDRVGLMLEGTLLALDTPDMLINNFPYHLYQLQSESPYETFESLQKTEFGCCIQLFGSGVHLLDRENLGPTELQKRLEQFSIEPGNIISLTPQFEDVFLEYMTANQKG